MEGRREESREGERKAGKERGVYRLSQRRAWCALGWFRGFLPFSPHRRPVRVNKN